ncbi:hypothetical protein SATMO3_43740 [Sporomusa aerivorans]
MICKNEEEQLQACLRSVKHLTHEIIIVDTGSEDKTVSLARAEGAVVYEYPWNDNFAEARNFGLDQAKGQWILVLDADEVLLNAERDYISSILQEPGKEGYFLTIHSYVGQGEEMIEDQVVRLFKNNPVYRFRGAIHEQIAGSIQEYNQGAGLGIAADVTISHCGYLNTVKAAKNKHVRNVTVIKKALKDNPDDPLLLYSLGIEHLQVGELAASVEQLEYALRFLYGSEGYFSNVLTMLGTGYLRLNEKAKLAALLQEALRMLPENADLHLLKGMLAFANAEYELVIEELQSITGTQSDILPEYSICKLLGDACRITGRYREADQAYAKMLVLISNYKPV